MEKNLIEFLKNAKDKVDMAVATVMHKIVDPTTKSMKRRNSNVAADYPGPVNTLAQLETQLVRAQGTPEGLDRPIFDIGTPLTEIFSGYEETSPAIRAMENKNNREMIKEFSKKAPNLYSGQSWADFDGAEASDVRRIP